MMTGNPITTNVDDKVILGTYPDMLQKLNNMTEAFVNEFNTIHKHGYALGQMHKSSDDFFIIDTIR